MSDDNGNHKQLISIEDDNNYDGDNDDNEVDRLAWQYRSLRLCRSNDIPNEICFSSGDIDSSIDEK